MSFERATELVAALAGGDADPAASSLGARLRGTENPSAVADALVATTVPKRAAGGGRFHLVASSLVAVAAGILAARGLADLEAVLPGASTSWPLLPLVALPLVAMAWVLGPFVTARLERRQAAAVATDVARALRRAGVEPSLALETATHVAGIERAEASQMFDVAALDAGLALASLGRRRVQMLRGPMFAAVGVGAALAWVVITFWGSYFVAFGRAAMVGVW